mmetsp:Transcript_66246/g.155200  ORF Transcript_66246/g.155200 Transcript_66246/m.155200 type:complete len:107 (-) Transcript_66246:137-457(-)
MAGCTDEAWVNLGELVELHATLRSIMLKVGGPVFSEWEISAAANDLVQVSASDLEELHSTLRAAMKKKADGFPKKGNQKKKQKKSKKHIDIVGLTTMQKLRLGQKL